MSPGSLHRCSPGVVLTASALLAACATAAPAGSGGQLFVPSRTPLGMAVPVGPSEADPLFIARFRQHQDSPGAWDSMQLRDLSESVSQIMAASATVPTFRRAVAEGDAELLRLSCDLEGRVTAARLRIPELRQLHHTCDLLFGSASAAETPCPSTLEPIRASFRDLADNNQPRSRREVAKAVSLYGKCASSHAVQRTPVDPHSRGFIVVLGLEMIDAPENFYLGHEGGTPDAATEMSSTWKLIQATGR